MGRPAPQRARRGFKLLHREGRHGEETRGHGLVDGDFFEIERDRLGLSGAVLGNSNDGFWKPNPTRKDLALLAQGATGLRLGINEPASRRVEKAVEDNVRRVDERNFLARDAVNGDFALILDAATVALDAAIKTEALPRIGAKPFDLLGTEDRLAPLGGVRRVLDALPGIVAVERGDLDVLVGGRLNALPFGRLEKDFDGGAGLLRGIGRVGGDERAHEMDG